MIIIYLINHSTSKPFNQVSTWVLIEIIGISIIIFNLSTYFGMNPFILLFFS